MFYLCTKKRFRFYFITMIARPSRAQKLLLKRYSLSDGLISFGSLVPPVCPESRQLRLSEIQENRRAECVLTSLREKCFPGSASENWTVPLVTKNHILRLRLCHWVTGKEFSVSTPRVYSICGCSPSKSLGKNVTWISIVMIFPTPTATLNSCTRKENHAVSTKLHYNYFLYYFPSTFYPLLAQAPWRLCYTHTLFLIIYIAFTY